MRSSALEALPEASDPALRQAGPAMPQPPRTDAERVFAICDAMIDISAALFNVSSKELRQTGRSSLGISRIRQIAMYVTHVSLGLSMREVGNGFGRDRTTVLHACHQIEDMRDDEEFDEIVVRVERVARAAFAHSGWNLGVR